MMVQNKALKLRLYPNKEQSQKIIQFCGANRFIYNKMLEERQQAYKEFKENGNLDALWAHKYKTEVNYKNEFEWMKDVESTSLQQSRRHLIDAYNNFFKSLKKQRKGNSQFPKFKKKGIKDSYTSVNNANTIRVDYDNHKIKLPKLGWVSYRDTRILNDILIKRATISVSRTGKFFVSVLYEYGIDIPEKLTYSNDLIINALDMSLENFYIDCNNNHPDYIKQYRKNLSHLKYLQRQVSKKKKDSSNRKKVQFKVNKVYEKIANSRKDFIEKLSNDLIEKNDVIIIESLNIKAMSQCLNLGKSTLDLGWGMFVNRLEQKISTTNKLLIKADKWFASSQICHVCGYQNKSLTLHDREWTCPNCGSHLLRDENAAINLKQYGINILKNSRYELPGEPLEMSSEEESMKEESYDFSHN